MSYHTVDAEYDQLNAVRVHTPGAEILSGGLNPVENLFIDTVPPDQARREHEEIIATLENEGVEVRQLANELEEAGVLNDLVKEMVTVEGASELFDAADTPYALTTFEPREKLQLVLSRLRLQRYETAAIAGDDNHADESSGTSLWIDRPISNMYFQRDTTILGDQGPILCNMRKPVRQPETPIVQAAWEGVNAEITHQVTDEPIEGGEFIPAGEFALVGTSAQVDDEEVIIRTSYAAGRQLLDVGAVGYDEVGLVRAPLKTDQKRAEEYRMEPRTMHLLGWFNIAADKLAVTFEDLAINATVDVYKRANNGYHKHRTTTVLDYIHGKGYETINAQWTERWPTNFLTIDDERVLTIYEPDVNGAYQPENNPTIEALNDRGIDVVPNGTGVAPEALICGGGGIHCMTTPLSRG